MLTKYLSLEKQMVLALILGLVFGYFVPSYVEYFSFLGQIFLRLLKLIALPLIAFSVLNALMDLKSLQEFKKMGGLTFLFYFLTSFLAFVITFIIASLFDVSVEGIGPKTNIAMGKSSFVETFIPTNMFEMLSSGNIIQIIFFCLFVGVLSFSLTKKNNETLKNLVDLGQELCLKAITTVLYLAPIGIFSLVAQTMSSLDYKILPQIAKLCLLLAVCLVIHSLITLPGLAKILGKFNGYGFLTKMKKPLILALSTASSNATLPVSLEAIKAKGKVSDKVADFVLPLGATFNMDGSAMFQTLIYLCIASVAGVTLSGTDYLMLIFIVVFSSVGVAGIPGGALAVTAYMFNFLGLPEEYLGVVILLDRFFDYPITMVNVWGDLIGAKILNQKV